MLYKRYSTGQTMEVLEGDTAKRRILERSGWRIVTTTVEPVKPEVPLVPEPVAPEAMSMIIDDLPDDFPERDALTDAGYGALLLVSKATDDELRAVPGIGKAKLKAIRDYASV